MSAVQQEHVGAVAQGPSNETDTERYQRLWAAQPGVEEPWVLVEWLGQPETDSYVYLTDEDGNFLMDDYGRYKVELDYDVENKRTVRVVGHSEMFATPEHIRGMSRYYKWGPEVFGARMVPADWQAMQVALPESMMRQFREVRRSE